MCLPEIFHHKWPAGLILIIGGVLLYGVGKRWRWLVDPPESWSPFYSQSFLKENFGSRAPILIARIVAIGSLAFGLIWLAFA
jgi:hypothetical protein